MSAPIKINDPMKIDQNGHNKKAKNTCCFSWRGRKVKPRDGAIINTDGPEFQITPNKYPAKKVDA